MKRKLHLLTSTALLFLLSHSLEAGEQWSDGPDASVVLGQIDFEAGGISGSTEDTLNGPWGIAVDPTTGKLFIADTRNHRVLRYASYASLSNGIAAEAVLGQPDLTSTTPGLSSSRFDSPQGLAFDAEGRLWIADSGNARVLRFDAASTLASSPSADGVFGQPDFDSKTNATTISGLRLPRGIALDAAGNLFVTDVTASRVVMYADAANLADGSDASLVLGQTNFTGITAATAQNRMSSPNSVALDPFGNLYVADRGNHRVLRFDDAAGLTNGANASNVLGQIDFVTRVTETSATGMNGPIDLTVDGDGVLWVADYSNARVIGFDTPENLLNTAPAVRVIGQDDLVTHVAAFERNRFGTPAGVAVDASGRLYATDFIAHRALIFEKDRFQPDFSIGEKSTSQVGRNRYNRNGSGQKKRITTSGKEVKFTALLGNDGNVPDNYFVQSLKSNSKFRIKVFSLSGGKRNITGSAKTGSYDSGSMSAGSSKTFEMRVRAKSKTREKRATRKVWLDAKSATDSERDRVIGEVKNRP